MNHNEKIINLESAKHVQYTLSGANFMDAKKRNGRWHLNCLDGISGEREWHDDKVFNTADELVDYIANCECVSMRAYAEHLRMLSQNVVVDIDPEFVRNVVVDKMRISES